MGTLLTWLDEPRGVFTVMTLNRTAGIPAEMLRRGRLDAVFAVGMPDAAASLEVLQIHLRKRGKAVAGLEDVAAQSAGYVPAELESAVKDAILESFSDGQPLAAGRILDCLRSSPPLSSAFRAQFQAMAEWAKDNARAAA
jgi:SpoVK/Ycf46/Vps4 family AAA+-type ATPase